MGDSYFELLTEQEGIPAKSFDPVEELKRLRRGLTLRLQISKPSAEEVADLLPFQAESETKEAVPLPSGKMELPDSEPVSFESVMQKAGEIKKTLTFWQRSRIRTKPGRNAIFRGIQKVRYSRAKSLGVAQFLTTPQEGTLKTVNAGLMALGMIAVVFGVLCFFRGLESDLSIGSLVCVTGAAIAVIGLGGRVLASRFDLSR